MQTVVTGGAGFIGSHLVDALVADGHRVRVLDDLSTGSLHDVSADAEFVRGDVTDLTTVAGVLLGADVVFHQAAHRAVPKSVDHPLESDRVNTGGTLTVLQAARSVGVRRVVAASSSSVYGDAATLPTPETAPPAPLSPYAVSKVAGEQYCRVYSEMFGVETVSLRYFNVYGPRQRPTAPYATAIPRFVDALSRAESAQIYGDGLQRRDFCYVDDAVQANMAAASAPARVCSGKAYNVAGGAPLSILEVLAVLSRLMGSGPVPVHLPGRPGDVRHTEADISAAARDLGHRPRVGFDTGLAWTVDWLTGDRALPWNAGRPGRSAGR